jgi:hypothetical protein
LDLKIIWSSAYSNCNFEFAIFFWSKIVILILIQNISCSWSALLILQSLIHGTLYIIRKDKFEADSKQVKNHHEFTPDKCEPKYVWCDQRPKWPQVNKHHVLNIVVLSTTSNTCCLPIYCGLICNTSNHVKA